jgi:short-subunit dehydrogenase
MAIGANPPSNVVIFGGSSDIARAITKKLCSSGTHSVILAGRNQELLNVCAREAEDHGATKTGTVLFDANDPSSAEGAVREAFAMIDGPISLVIVAVGLLGSQFEKEVDAELAAQMITVNVTWPVAALTEIRHRLIDQGSGRIVVMSSAAAIRVRRITYLYSGAKAGLDRLCVGMAQSLEGTGVSLQLLRPGVVRTRMTLGTKGVPFTTGPNEVADNVMRGLDSNELVIWSPPLLRYVFFFLRHLPTPLWRKIADR